MTRAYDGLPRATLGFLRDLAANNSRDWLMTNRAAYERDWRDAGLDLVAALGPWCEAARPQLLAVPKLGGSLRRLNRDTRFSNDKTPFAPMLHLAFTLNGRSRHAGMHLVLHPDHLGFGAGEFRPPAESLTTLRARFCDPSDRAALISAAALAKDVGSEWDAPDLKRVPAGWEGGPEWEHLLRRKSVIMRGRMPIPDWLFDMRAVPELERLFAAHLPLLRWLSG